MINLQEALFVSLQMFTVSMIQRPFVKFMVLDQPSRKLPSTTRLETQTKSMQICSQSWTTGGTQSSGESWHRCTQ